MAEPTTGLFIARYAQVAGERPGAPALEWRLAGEPVQTLTHGELWARAGKVAACLNAAGLGAEAVLGLPYGRSPEFIIGLLGVWRVRAAWVCLDPALPAVRRRDCAARAGVQALLHLDTGVPVLAWCDRPATGGEGEEPTAAGRASDLAYIAFTSGSSGRPRGVRIEQRGLVPLLEAQIAAFGLGPASRCLWVLAPAFDASLSDIGTALLAGGTLLLESPNPLAAPDRLVAVLTERQVTAIDLPPSLLPRLDPARLPPTLHTVVIGGEVADPAAVRAWAGRVNLVNVYGPTEATVCTSLARCTPDWDQPRLGQPLPGVGYRLEGDELWITGPGLARDYAGEPAATACRFVARDGVRWYRTGDRVSRDRDEWVFHGRLDRQVQLAGKRAEPEEVEAALTRLGLRAAVVPGSFGATLGLIAFVEGGNAGDAPGWARSLAAELPAWLVPRRFIVLAALPRLPSGKVDHAALARLPVMGEPSAGPRDPLEARIGDLFARVLGLPQVGRDADFFALGGDSLALLDLLVAAAAEGLALSAARLQATPRVRDLAASLRAGPEPEWQTTARLAARIPRFTSPSAGPGGGGALLVTGATGFLGRRLCQALTARGERVIALVRAPDTAAAQARLGPGAGEALAGDLARPRLGVTARTWERLTAEVGVVVHLGARVDLAADLARLAPVNIGGTAAALDLARAAGARFVHASTLSVFVASDRPDRVFYEDDDLRTPCQLAGGYAQSKWVAEAAVRRAGVDAVLVRYGLLSPPRAGEGAPAADWFGHFVRALARLGSVPADWEESDLGCDLTPLDDAVAATLAILAQPPGGASAAVHVAGERPIGVGRLLTAMRAAGVRLTPVAPAQFRARARSAPLVLGLTRTPGPGDGRPHRAFAVFAASGVRFDRRRALALGAAIPGLDDEYLRRMVRQLLAPRAAGAEGLDPVGRR